MPIPYGEPDPKVWAREFLEDEPITPFEIRAWFAGALSAGFMKGWDTAQPMVKWWQVWRKEWWTA